MKNYAVIWFLGACLMACHSTRKIKVNSSNTLKAKSSLQQQVNYWMGTPYRLGGTTKQGIDCSGLVCAIYLNVYHVKLPRTSAAQFANCQKIVEKEVKEGDLVFFKIGSTAISHVGIYLKEHQFLHASSSKGVIISNLQEPYYKKYFASYGRIKHP